MAKDKRRMNRVFIRIVYDGECAYDRFCDYLFTSATNG